MLTHIAAWIANPFHFRPSAYIHSPFIDLVSTRTTSRHLVGFSLRSPKSPSARSNDSQLRLRLAPRPMSSVAELALDLSPGWVADSLSGSTAVRLSSEPELSNFLFFASRSIARRNPQFPKYQISQVREEHRQTDQYRRFKKPVRKIAHRSPRKLHFPVNHPIDLGWYRRGFGISRR